MIKDQGYLLVLQCPTCGARAGLRAGKTHCSQPEHSPMQLARASNGILLTPQECQEHQAELAAIRERKPQQQRKRARQSSG